MFETNGNDQENLKTLNVLKNQDAVICACFFLRLFQIQLLSPGGYAIKHKQTQNKTEAINLVEVEAKII